MSDGNLQILFCLTFVWNDRHTNKLSQTLQNPKLSSTEGYEIAMLTVKTLESLCTDINFDLYWDKAELIRVKRDIDEPQLPRKRKMPN